MACQKNHEKVVRVLLDRGADMDIHVKVWRVVSFFFFLSLFFFFGLLSFFLFFEVIFEFFSLEAPLFLLLLN